MVAPQNKVTVISVVAVRDKVSVATYLLLVAAVGTTASEIETLQQKPVTAFAAIEAVVDVALSALAVV